MPIEWLPEGQGPVPRPDASPTRGDLDRDRRLPRRRRGDPRASRCAAPRSSASPPPTAWRSRPGLDADDLRTLRSDIAAAAETCARPGPPPSTLPGRSTAACARSTRPRRVRESARIAWHGRVAIHEEDIAANHRIGDYGADLLRDRRLVLTHCNAGALATGGYGTALGVIRSAVGGGRPRSRHRHARRDPSSRARA